jgi:hypothetical protein
MTIAVKSVSMTPIVEETIQKWKCRHCKHRWHIDNPEAITNKKLRPKQCPNRKCRAMDWDRPKKLEGRPLTKTKPGRPKGRGKKRVKG